MSLTDSAIYDNTEEIKHDLSVIRQFIENIDIELNNLRTSVELNSSEILNSLDQIKETLNAKDSVSSYPAAVGFSGGILPNGPSGRILSQSVQLTTEHDEVVTDGLGNQRDLFGRRV